MARAPPLTEATPVAMPSMPSVRLDALLTGQCHETTLTLLVWQFSSSFIYIKKRPCLNAGPSCISISISLQFTRVIPLYSYLQSKNKSKSRQRSIESLFSFLFDFACKSTKKNYKSIVKCNKILQINKIYMYEFGRKKEEVGNFVAYEGLK